MKPSLQELLEELARLAPRGIKLDLERMRGGLAALGDPHRAVPCVHIAGTNGKGSTSAMVEEAARRAGLRTGLTTSPHLSRFAERIRIGGEPIGDEAFAAALEKVLRGVAEPLTFFEALTAAAFVAFAEAGVELAILEVGLGGRLDATNVVEAPLCTAITSIALDHTEWLGPTVSDVAREKAGILKAGAPVVLGPLDAKPEAVIEAVARTVGAGPRWHVHRGAGGMGEIAVARDGRRVHVAGPGGRMVEATLGLAGPHQADNAGVACGVVWRLAERWPGIAGVLGEALEGVRWPGRMERFEVGGRTVLLDCAHNPHGAAALVAALGEERGTAGVGAGMGAGVGAGVEETTLVFGAMADKAWGEMLAVLAPAAGRRVYATPRGRAAAAVEELAKAAAGEAVGEPKAALARAVEITPEGGVVVVTGSIYLVGEIRAGLLGIEMDPPVGL